MSIIIVIIGGLITWRLANMLIKQNGPLAVFARLRAFLAFKQKRPGGLFEVYTCMSCVSIQFAAVTAIAPSRTVLEWLGYTLSFSAIATLLDAYLQSK